MAFHAAFRFAGVSPQQASALAMATFLALPGVVQAQFVGVAQSAKVLVGGSSSCVGAGCTGFNSGDAQSTSDLGSLTLSTSISGASSFSVKASATYTSVIAGDLISIREDEAATAQATALAAQDAWPSGRASGSVSGTITFDVLDTTQVTVSGQDFGLFTPPGIPFWSSLSLRRLHADGSFSDVAARQDLFGITSLDAGRYMLSMSQGSEVSALSQYPYAGGVTFLSIRAAVPEPGTYALMGLGLAGMGLAVRRRQRR